MPARRMETDGLALPKQCNRALLKRTRVRILTIMAIFCIAYSCVGARLSYLTFFHENAVQAQRPATVLGSIDSDDASVSETASVQRNRPQILDRHGNILATTVQKSALYANPQKIENPLKAAQALHKIFPHIPLDTLTARLGSGRKFVWIERRLSPQQVFAVNKLGTPGLEFSVTQERVYPHGRLFAHSLGFTDVDNKGLAGLELALDNGLIPARNAQIVTSFDTRVQHILHRELSSAIRKFNAIGGGGLVMDVHSGEVIALVSLPDFDPVNIKSSETKSLFNRITKGVYEQGSTLKTFAVAAALDSGAVSLKEKFDVTEPIKRAGFTIRDYHRSKHPLNTAEIFVESSNIGTALIAEEMGTQAFRNALARFGLFETPDFELKELGRPLIPERWGDIHTVTASFGHGIAISPLSLATATATVVNDGYRVKPTLLKTPTESLQRREQILSPHVSRTIRDLMRLTVTDGTASKANIEGYKVGGKTGTAEKAMAGGYANKALLSSFIGIFPSDAPRYIVFAMIDEPKGRKDTWGYATGGWTAAPVVGNVISEAAPLLDVAYDPQPRRQLDRIRYTMGVRSKQKGVTVASH